jgi:hypothetical protein
MKSLSKSGIGLGMILAVLALKNSLKSSFPYLGRLDFGQSLYRELSWSSALLK